MNFYTIAKVNFVNEKLFLEFYNKYIIINY